MEAGGVAPFEETTSAARLRTAIRGHIKGVPGKTSGANRPNGTWVRLPPPPPTPTGEKAMQPLTSQELLSRSLGDQESNGLALCSILAKLEDINAQISLMVTQNTSALERIAQPELDLGEPLAPGDLKTDTTRWGHPIPDVSSGVGESVDLPSEEPVEEEADTGMADAEEKEAPTDVK